MNRSYLTSGSAKRAVRSRRYKREKPLVAPVNPTFRKRLEREGWEKGEGGRLWYPPGDKPPAPQTEWGGGSPHKA